MTSDDLIGLGYVVAAALFVLGLKGLSKPRTAVRGNQLGAAGMLVAVLVTLTDRQIVSFWQLFVGVVIGALVGGALALRVQMTSMPQLVALFNGFGGLASVLVAAASFFEAVGRGTEDVQVSVAAGVTAFIGAVTFTGSLVAATKLLEVWEGVVVPGARGVNVALAGASLVLGVLMVNDPHQRVWFWLLVAAAGVLGVTATSPIGGADMPVVIALLNSMSGLAASTAGFVLDNALLIIAGALVGASGLILTGIMTKAMNRTLVSVLFGDPPSAGGGADADEVYDGKVTSTSSDEVAMILDSAERVVIVPGYGLAVAQAQHAVRDLTRALQANGCDVVFGIHPVAGRMPGHMNVLLAEAEIEYEALIEMAEVNPTFEQTDVAIVIGANDVVNPVARGSEGPIAGMPILDVDKARVVVVIKRSLSPGFAGIPNPLFAAQNSMMLYGDGKAAVVEITKALAEI
ncbi:MAG: NAD(P)(+) transhydrogenase (Re/Si-specific) subunit beta [Acidimicrobiales bacterium]